MTPAPGTPALPVLGPAPDFTGITRWLNGAPVSIPKQVATGKVTLVDFWTYTCINCLRTLPYLKAWDTRYADKGLTIVGVQAPEFSFEKKTSNVQAAIERLGLRYPVAQDNDLATWNAWGNQYWPAKYLIDAKGQVRYAHAGEGDYGETEKAIRALLAEAGSTGLATDEAEPTDALVPSQVATPETYLGAQRAMGWLRPPSIGTRTYPAPPRTLPPNAFAFSGRWTVSDQAATAGSGARIDAEVTAKDVYLVLSPPAGGKTGTVRVRIDGKPTETVRVTSQKLYTLAALGRNGRHRLTLDVSPGTAGYAFTFG